MSLRISMMLFWAATLLAVPAEANIRIGEQKLFKDWIVACDNTLSCEAIALRPESSADDILLLTVSRDAATGEAKVQLSGSESKSDGYRILIDGRVVQRGAVKKDTYPAIEIVDAAALKLTRAMAKGIKLTLQDGSGSILGHASLSGSSAALRYIDASQNRQGTGLALLAKGRKMAQPQSLPLPILTVKRIVPAEKTPDAAALVELVESSPCAEERQNVTEDSAYSLGIADGKAKSLVLINCGSGAYNIAYAAYTGTEEPNGKWRFMPARFDYDNGVRSQDKAVQLLINADWNSATQRLSSFSKGRGLSDCGNGETYVWDGDMFRLTAADGMAECRGSLEWLTLWQAEAKIVD
jgi:hypothetical protein